MKGDEPLEAKGTGQRLQGVAEGHADGHSQGRAGEHRTEQHAQADARPQPVAEDQQGGQGDARRRPDRGGVDLHGGHPQPHPDRQMVDHGQGEDLEEVDGQTLDSGAFGIQGFKHHSHPARQQSCCRVNITTKGGILVPIQIIPPEERLRHLEDYYADRVTAFRQRLARLRPGIRSVLSSATLCVSPSLTAPISIPCGP